VLVRKLYLDFWTGRGLAVELGEKIMNLERESRPSRIEDRAAMALGVCLKQADRFGEARHWFAQMLRAAREEGDESSLPNLLAHLADLECWAGNWTAAERYAAQSWEADQRVGGARGPAPGLSQPDQPRPGDLPAQGVRLHRGRAARAGGHPAADQGAPRPAAVPAV
jgi:hypothetical protein